MLEAIEEGLIDRVASLSEMHKKLYAVSPEVVVRSPGRAEIIGNHVDYCGGKVLTGAIEQSCLVSSSLNGTKVNRIFSEGYGTQPLEISADEVREGNLQSDHLWGGYTKSIFRQLWMQGIAAEGLDLAISSTVPSSGGVSSSAAFELGVARTIVEHAGVTVAVKDLALWCQRAEQAVGSNCGLLDQYAVALSEAGMFTIIDFSANTVAKKKVAMGENCFVVYYDPELKRNLGETAYSDRRKACEDGLVILSELSGCEYAGLSEFDYDKLSGYRNAFIDSAVAKGLDGAKTYRRLEHVLSEMKRTKESLRCLESQDIAGFAQHLTGSGVSALDNYELDAGVPELRYVFEELLKTQGVLGARNMGGGFSVVLLAMVANEAQEAVNKTICEAYEQKFGRSLKSLRFKPSDGTAVLPR